MSGQSLCIPYINIFAKLACSEEGKIPWRKINFSCEQFFENNYWSDDVPFSDPTFLPSTVFRSLYQHFLLSAKKPSFKCAFLFNYTIGWSSFTTSEWLLFKPTAWCNSKWTFHSSINTIISDEDIDIINNALSDSEGSADSCQRNVVHSRNKTL